MLLATGRTVSQRLIPVLAWVLAGATGGAALAQTHDLRYEPTLGDKLTRVVVLNGVVIATDPDGMEWLKVPAYVAAKQTTECTAINEDSFTMTATISDLNVRLADAEIDLDATEAKLELQMDYLGRVLEMAVVDPPNRTFFTAALSAVGPALLSIGRFKGEPVAVDEAWSVEDVIEAGGEELTAKCETRLVEINDETAVLESVGEISVPAIDLNMAGFQLDIQSGTLSLQKFRREFDLKKSKTSAVRAELGVLFSTSTDVMRFGLRGTFELTVGPPPPGAEE